MFGFKKSSSLKALGVLVFGHSRIVKIKFYYAGLMILIANIL